jgi:hypothetical protein
LPRAGTVQLTPVEKRVGTVNVRSGRVAGPALGQGAKRGD